MSALKGEMTTLRNQPITYERDPKTFVNEGGVIATLKNHEYYAGQIYDYFQHLDMLKSKQP